MFSHWLTQYFISLSFVLGNLLCWVPHFFSSDRITFFKIWIMGQNKFHINITIFFLNVSHMFFSTKFLEKTNTFYGIVESNSAKLILDVWMKKIDLEDFDTLIEETFVRGILWINFCESTNTEHFAL